MEVSRIEIQLSKVLFCHREALRLVRLGLERAGLANKMPRR